MAAAQRAITGKLVVVSGPSGSGKTTIVRRLRDIPGVFYSVSVTTRKPRTGEVDGVDYRFVSLEEFARMICADAFAEHAEVAGNLYGTPMAPLEDALARGSRALVDIDVQGAMQIKERFPAAVLVFIEPPSMRELERRLRARGTEPEDSIRRRLDLAAGEMQYAPRYNVRVVNDVLDRAVEKVKKVLTSEE
jgi:guanylate kinase